MARRSRVAAQPPHLWTSDPALTENRGLPVSRAGARRSASILFAVRRRARKKKGVKPSGKDNLPAGLRRELEDMLPELSRGMIPRRQRYVHEGAVRQRAETPGVPLPAY